MLEGSFALAIISSDEKKIIAVRKDSPLVIGVAIDGYFVASDSPSFLDYTKNVIYMQDYDMAVIMQDSIKFYNIKDGSYVKREVDSIAWDTEKAKKGDFKHFMLKEITEQAEIIKETMNLDDDRILHIAGLINQSNDIVFIAAGSSYNACLSASYKFTKLARKKTSVYLASEFNNFKEPINEQSVIIAVSQSGETADVLDAIKSAKGQKAKIIAITNAQGSSIT
jgi:glutamine---fructose-6-phosphate transaminase (isomerizing)